MATPESPNTAGCVVAPANLAQAVEALGRRELNRMATTEGIVNACLDLGEELGWDAVTVDAVADRAGVSRRTFFNYFSSLAEAVHYPLTVIIQDALIRLKVPQGNGGASEETSGTGGPLDYTQALTDSIRLELLAPATRTLLLARASSALRTESLRTWENSITQLIEPFQGLSPNARLVIEVQVRAAVTAVQVAFEHWAAALTGRPTKADVEALRLHAVRAVSLISPLGMLPASDAGGTADTSGGQDDGEDSSRKQGNHGNGQYLQHSAWASWLTSDEREEIYSSNFFEDSRKYGT